MSNFNFAPEQFLGLQELNRFQKFIKDAHIENVIDNVGIFGIIHRNSDTYFRNFKIQAASNSILEIANTSHAIDKDGLTITQRPTTFQLPAENIWYWIIISHKYDSVEEGSISIDSTGTISGTSTKFLEILRGQPNFATKISFPNSSSNHGEYLVVDVVDNTNAVISGTVVSESNLNYCVVGTFTPGTVQNQQHKFPYQYDSCTLEIVQELSVDTNPIASNGKKFSIARVMNDGQSLIIQDKRIEIYSDNTLKQLTSTPNQPNDLIGIESVTFDTVDSVRDQNIVFIGWGFRSVNFTIDSNTNKIVITAGEGGRYKSVVDFDLSYFDGWIVYLSNGYKCKVIQSQRVGFQINLFVEYFDPKWFDLSSSTPPSIIVAPDCEQIEIYVSDDNNGDGYNPSNAIIQSRSAHQIHTFDIASGYGCFKVNNFGRDFRYFLKYRYKNHGSYSSWFYFKSDTQGYYTEQSFTSSGKLQSPEIRRPYLTSNVNIGFLTVTAPSESFVVSYKLGNLPGVQYISLPSQGIVELKVGQSKQTQIVTGGSSLSGNLAINLNHFDNSSVKNGAFFTIVLKGTITIGNGYKFTINSQDTSLPTVVENILYQVSSADGNYAGLLNRQVVLQCVFNGVTWEVYKLEGDNSKLGDIVMRSNISNSDFDSSGKGISNDTVGWCLCNGKNGTIDLRSRFIVGYDDRSSQPIITPHWDIDYNVIGSVGGQKAVSITIPQMPPHRHSEEEVSQGKGGLVRKSKVGEANTIFASVDEQGSGLQPDLISPPLPIPMQGEGEPHENRPPYIVLAFIQRV